MINLISDHCKKDDSTKVYSFGISSGCDQDLIKRAAKAGQGAHSIIMDEDMPLLKEKVIESLRRAGVPAMQGCNFDFGNGQAPGFNDGEILMGANRELGSLYQNELVRVYSLMSEPEFKKLNCTFSVKYDPETKKGHSEKIKLDKFKEIQCSDKSYLFKLAAKDSIEKSAEVKVTDAQLQETSVKYQVLSKNTCFVGIKG